MKSHKQMIKAWKEDPKFKNAYDELEEEFSIQKELLRARSKAGMTQEQIAEKMNTKREAVTRLESSGNSPSLTTLKKYAHAVGCKLQIKLVPQPKLKKA